MKSREISILVIAFLLVPAGLLTAKAHAQQQGSREEYGQQRNDWETAPQEWNDVQRQGFHDGIASARKDVENHRNPDLNNRDEYRHPNVPERDREAYREGFQRGYQTAMSRLMGQAEHLQEPAPRAELNQQHNDWETAPQEWNDVRRQGFRDGVAGARKDMENHRNPNVNNRDEYRHPSVPGRDRAAYREGFQRGYETAMSHLMGETERR